MRGYMPASEVRNWLGIYLLVFMGVFGGVLLLAGQFLPLESEEVTSCFQIMVPFLAGQVVTVSRYFTGHARTSASELPVPAWLVKIPLIMVTALLAVGLVMLFVGGGLQATWVPSPGQFKGLVTFSVTVLTITSVVVIAKYFEVSKPDPDGSKSEAAAKPTP